MIYKLSVIIIICLLFVTPGWGDTSFIEITSLPYEISTHTGATWDVYSLSDDSGGTLHCDSFGIWFSSNSANDYVLFDFSGDDGIPGNADDDSLVIGIDPDWYGFDMGYSTSIGAFGLMTGKYNVLAESLKIRGGYWLSLPTGITCSTDYAIVGVKAANHRMIYSVSGGLKNCVFDSIAELTVRGCGVVKTDEFGTGAGSYGISYKGSGVCINGGTFKMKTYAIGSRHNYYSCIITYTSSVGNSPTLTGDQQYHFRAVGATFDCVGHTALNLWGAESNSASYEPTFFQVDSCDITMDNHNSDPANGYVNGWGIHFRGAFSEDPYYSYIRNCTFHSGTTFGGGRGIEIRECNTYMNGTFGSDTIDISNNRFDRMHCGYDSSDIGFYRVGGQCVKFRRGNQHVRLHDNSMSFELDSADRHPESDHNFQGTVIQLMPEMDWDDDIRQPYDIHIYNNYCSLFVLSDSADAYSYEEFIGTAMNIGGMPNSWVGEFDSTIKIYDNTFYSEGGYVFGFASQYDASCQDVKVGPGNTFILNDDQGLNKGVFALYGYKGIGNNNLIILDPTYSGDASDFDINHWWDLGQTGSYGQVDYNVTDTYEVVFERTCSLFVKGNNELAVTSAACSLWNNYGQLVISGVTDSNGVIVDVVSYYYYARNWADSTFNNFTFKAILAADSAIGTHTVAWTAAGGTDTLTLSSTIGTGIYLGTEEILPGFKFEDRPFNIGGGQSWGCIDEAIFRRLFLAVSY